MKKWETTFNNNHLRLMRVHIGFVVFYILLALLYIFFLYYFSSDMKVSTIIFTCIAFFIPLILLHILLMIGAKNKSELSRKISEIVFAFLLLAFPIGTILALLYFLPKTTWKIPDDKPTA